MGANAGRVRVLRVISRLNVGGPAIQAITLTRLLGPRGYDTTLVAGSEDPREGNMDHLAAALGVTPRRVRSLRRNPGMHDATALLALIAITRRARPQVVHTHAAKGGTLGRLAGLLALPGARPVIVHTFHGHSLSGYFSRRLNRVFLTIERLLARRTDCLIAVSEEVRDELVAMGVAPVERFAIVRVGFDLAPFQATTQQRAAQAAAVRSELGIAAGEQLVTLVARLVPIKRVDRFLRVALRVASERDVRFLVAGDGELHEQLHASPEAAQLGDRLVWAGLRRDMPAIAFASDVVVLTSDNEGTPVSLIEALAAAVPVVSTDVGGVGTVVRDGETGLLAAAADEAGLAAAIVRLLEDPPLADRLAAAGRRHALASFSIDRLLDDIDSLYRELLAR